nr:hypothetical protein [uncultured Methanoregula sp.]
MTGSPGTARTFDKCIASWLRCTADSGPVGKPVPNAAGVDRMKTQLYDGSRKTTVDTKLDECLYSAPRPAVHSPDILRQGKDLYFHTDSEKKITYYLHLWSLGKKSADKIMPVSPATAERFLRSKGLVCNLFPKNDPIATLYNWGYGIAEEF